MSASLPLLLPSALRVACSVWALTDLRENDLQVLGGWVVFFASPCTSCVWNFFYPVNAGTFLAWLSQMIHFLPVGI